MIPFRLGLGNGLLEHLLAIQRLTILTAISLGDIVARALELPLRFCQFGSGLAVFRVGRPVGRFGQRKVLARLVQRIVELCELFPL
jgi:hypothetical protein